MTGPRVSFSHNVRPNRLSKKLSAQVKDGGQRQKLIVFLGFDVYVLLFQMQKLMVTNLSS